MSVLTDLSISYESLPGEPSFFMTAQQAVPMQHEIPQAPLSMPYLAQAKKPRHIESNFDFAPSFSTRHAVKRHATHQSKPSTPVYASKPQTAPISAIDIKPSVIAKTVTPSRATPEPSRGMFNDFERASLLSYMQRRQYS